MEDTSMSLKYKGTITLTLRDENKNIKCKRVVENSFLNVGKVWAIQRLFDDTTAVVSGTAGQYFYVGASVSGNNVGATATDTTAQCTFVSGGQANFTYQTGAVAGSMSATATFPTGTANAAITEAGIFAGTPVNAPLITGDGVFIARAQFTAINKLTTDTLQVKWDVSIA